MNHSVVSAACGVATTALPHSADVLTRRPAVATALRQFLEGRPTTKVCLLDELVARLFPELDDALCVGSRILLTDALEEEDREKLDVYLASTALQQILRWSTWEKFDEPTTRDGYHVVLSQNFVRRTPPSDHDTVVNTLIRDHIGRNQAISARRLAVRLNIPQDRVVRILKDIHGRGVHHAGNRRSSVWWAD